MTIDKPPSAPTGTLPERLAAIIEGILQILEAQLADGPLTSRMLAPLFARARRSLHDLTRRFAAIIAALEADRLAVPTSRAERTRDRPGPHPTSLSERLRGCLPAWLGGIAPAAPMRRSPTTRRCLAARPSGPSQPRAPAPSRPTAAAPVKIVEAPAQRRTPTLSAPTPAPIHSPVREPQPHPPMQRRKAPHRAAFQHVLIVAL